MNWTGGRLSRHSRRINSLTNRQKQHFAKGQSYRNGAKENSPHIRLILGHVIEDRRQPSVLNNKRGVNIRSNSQTVKYQDGRAAMEGDSLGQQTPGNKSTTSKIKIEHSSTPDDLYDATPPPRDGKRKREASVISFERGDVVKEDSVSEKRRRILQRSDWVGSSIQQPVQLAFSYPEHGGDIGRRRRITDGHRARFTSNQTFTASPFTKRQRVISPQNPITYRYQHPNTKPEVRISIGGRVVPPDISSSTVPSRHHGYSGRTRVQTLSQRASSDVMLLDNDTLASRSNSFYKRTNSHDGNLVLSSGYRERLNQDRSEFEEGNLIPELQSDDYSLNRSTTISQGHQEQHSQAISRAETSIFGVFTSSSVTVYHPKPQSSKVSVLLRSSSSDIANNTTAQVSPTKPVVPPSQALDNDIWETWITEPCDRKTVVSSAESIDSQHVVRPISINPGGSAIPLGLQKVDHKPSGYSFSGASSANIAADSYTNTYFIPHSKPPAGRNAIYRNSNISQNGQTIQVGFERMSRLNDTLSSEQLPSTAVRQANMDDLWRKFVFGEGSDYDGHYDVEAKHNEESHQMGNNYSSPTTDRECPDLPSDFRHSTKSLQSTSPELHSRRIRFKNIPTATTMGNIESHSSSRQSATVFQNFSSTQSARATYAASGTSVPSSSMPNKAWSSMTPFEPQTMINKSPPRKPHSDIVGTSSGNPSTQLRAASLHAAHRSFSSLIPNSANDSR
jgi:hypothetical protein